MSRERFRRLLPFVLLGFVAAGFEAWLLLSGRIPRSSDQAVVALMALHILAGRGHPVFYWGSAYGGTLESHLLVPVFALFGASPGIFRAFYVALEALFFTATTAFTFRFFGRRPALIAAALLALPPFFLPYKLLTSDGAYASVLLLTLATLWISLLAGERLEAGGRALALSAALGLVAGVGLWVTPVTLPVACVALAWLLAAPGVRPRAFRLAAWAAGCLVGAAPSLVWNARHGWGSVKAREMAPVAGASLLVNAKGFLLQSVPVLLGAARPNFSGDPHAPFPGAPVLVPLLVLALLVPAIVSLRRDRRFWLLAAVPAALSVAAVLAARLTPSEPRYLVGVYAALVPLLAVSVASVRTRTRRLLSAAGIAALLATGFSSGLQARRHFSDLDDSQVSGPLQPLLSALREVGARDVYANYWTAYRITFESREAIIATPVPKEDGTRYAPWDEEVRAAVRPAIVLLPPRDACFRNYLVETGEPFSEVRVGSFTIFHRLPVAIRDLVRAAGALPMPASGYRPVWSAVVLPTRMGPAEEVGARARVTNEGPCIWMKNVRLVASWTGPDAREDVFTTPDRRVPPGEAADLFFALRAPGRPGDYAVRLDLEQQGITRFSAKGGATVDARVTVAP